MSSFKILATNRVQVDDHTLLLRITVDCATSDTVSDTVSEPVQWSLYDGTQALPLHHTQPADHCFCPRGGQGARRVLNPWANPSCTASLHQPNAESGVLSVLLRTQQPLASHIDLCLVARCGAHTRATVSAYNDDDRADYRHYPVSRVLSLLGEWTTLPDVPVARLVDVFEKSKPLRRSWLQRKPHGTDTLLDELNVFAHVAHQRAIQRVRSAVEALLGIGQPTHVFQKGDEVDNVEPIIYKSLVVPSSTPRYC